MQEIHALLWRALEQEEEPEEGLVEVLEVLVVEAGCLGWLEGLI